MNALLQKAREVNGGAINGRSISYSNLSEDERIQMAADAVTNKVPFIPSITHAVPIFGITATQLREELDQRAAWQEAEQILQFAEALRCLPAHLRDAVIATAGAELVLESIDRFTR